MKNRFLFLEEWDANLDTLNKIKINNYLDSLSNHYLIIELSHKV